MSFSNASKVVRKSTAVSIIATRTHPAKSNLIIYQEEDERPQHNSIDKENNNNNIQQYHQVQSPPCTFDANPISNVAADKEGLIVTVENRTHCSLSSLGLSRSPSSVAHTNIPLYIAVPRKFSRPKSRLVEQAPSSTGIKGVDSGESPSSSNHYHSGTGCQNIKNSNHNNSPSSSTRSSTKSSAGELKLVSSSVRTTTTTLERQGAHWDPTLPISSLTRGFAHNKKTRSANTNKTRLGWLRKEDSDNSTETFSFPVVSSPTSTANTAVRASSAPSHHIPGLYPGHTETHQQGSHTYSSVPHHHCTPKNKLLDFLQPDIDNTRNRNRRRMPVPSPHATLNDLLNAQSPTRGKCERLHVSARGQGHGKGGGEGPPTSISVIHNRRRSTGDNMGEQYATLQQTGSGTMMPPHPTSRRNMGNSAGATATAGRITQRQGNLQSPSVSGYSSPVNANMNVPQNPNLGMNVVVENSYLVSSTRRGSGSHNHANAVPYGPNSNSKSVSPPQARDPNPFFAQNQHLNNQRVLSCGGTTTANATVPVPPAATTTTAMNPFDDPAIIGELDLKAPVLLTHQRSYEPQPHPLTSFTRANSTGSIRSIPRNSSKNDVAANAAAVSASSSSIPVPASKSSDGPPNPFSQFDPLSNNSTGVRRTAPATTTSGSGYSSPPMPTHRQAHTLDTASLADIAAALSTLKPQKVEVSEEEDQLESKRNHVITLGGKPKESTGTKKTHRRFLSHQFSKRKGLEDAWMNEDGVGGSLSGHSHRRTLSMNDTRDEGNRHRRTLSNTFFKNDRDQVGSEKDGGRKSNPGSRPMTPTSKEDSCERPITPVGSRRKLGLRLRGGDKDREKNSLRSSHSSDVTGAELLTIASGEEMGPSLSMSISASMSVSSPTSPNAEIKLRSSEQDPTPHQVRIPPASEVLFQAKLCQMFENYRVIDQNFDYSTLVGMTRQQMEMFASDGNSTGHPLINSSSPPRSLNVSISSNPSPPKSTENVFMQQPNPPNSLVSSLTYQPSQARLMAEHKPIISSLLEADDLILEGFYYDGYDGNSKSFDTAVEKSTMDRTEIVVFKSDARRQFIVVYQGSAEAQLKPVRKGEHKDGTNRRFQIGNKDGDNRFSEEQNIVVFPPFRKAYFTTCNMEEKVFAKLDELAEENPFFDVIMTGHSFGGALAQLSGMRYANARPAIMVSCFAYGCPKIGDLDFRYYVNSLPNLKVMRLEYGSDPWTSTPDHQTWVHAGHTIAMYKGEKMLDRETQSNPNAGNDTEQTVIVKAFKFGANRPDSGGGKKIGKILSKLPNNKQEKQLDHDISSYVHALDQVSKNPSIISWPKRFVGEEGTGVQGLNKEKRLVC